jgi:hypothetical protein
MAPWPPPSARRRVTDILSLYLLRAERPLRSRRQWDHRSGDDARSLHVVVRVVPMVARPAAR